MPFILLLIGVGIGVYALYKFLRRSTKEEAQRLLLSLAIGISVLMALVMILAGKYPIAAILAIILIPLITKLYKLLNPKK
jgi:predicted MFS family arabinose efflux permease